MLIKIIIFTIEPMKDNKGVNIDLDSIINRLLAVRTTKPGKMVNLKEDEIKGLSIKAKEIFLTQPALLDVEAPIKVCGTWSMT